ncbi:MAG: S8 family serine peptidase, partial [Actinomycetota bacterium]
TSTETESPAPEPTGTEPTASETTTPDSDSSASEPSGPQASIIAQFAPGLSAQEQQAVIDRNGGTETSQIPALRLHVIDVPAAEVSSYLSAYQSDSDVESVDRDRTRDAEGTPSDSEYSSQWGLPQIGWDQVFGSVAAGGSASIAVLDTGVNSGGDLSGRVSSGFSAFGGTTDDPNGHGTSLANIAAAATDNGAGIAGVAYGESVSIIPVRVLDANGLGQDSDIISGVVWAADHGADVILMGFSNPGFSSALQDAVTYAWGKGAVLVAATGNDGVSTPTYPAGDEYVAGVSATDQSDALWVSSNYGADTFLAAPGVGIADGSGSITGTSASAAIVAGSAALLKAADPAASNATILGRLARNADAAGTAEETGNGRVNLPRAIADTSTDGVTPAGAPGGGPFVGPYVAAAVNDANIAPGWAPTSTPTTFATLYRVTTGANVQHVRITLPVGYSAISVSASAFSPGSGTWDAGSISQANRTVDFALQSGSGLAVGGWARIDVTATTPNANQSSNNALWLMQTFTDAAGTTGVQADSPPVLIGDTTDPSASIAFVDAAGTPTPLPLQNGPATVRVRITQTGKGIKSTDVAVPVCFGTPFGVTTTVTGGGTGGYTSTITDGFIRLSGGTTPEGGFLTVTFNVTLACASGVYAVTVNPSTNAQNPPSTTNQSTSTSGGSLPVGVSDLSLTKTASPEPVRVGTTLTYTLTAHNDGPDPAAQVKVVDTLPSGVTNINASGTGWTCTTASLTVTCNLAGTIASGADASDITITVTAPSSAGSITNSTTVSSPNDNTSGNNSSSVTSTVVNTSAVTFNQSGIPTGVSNDTGTNQVLSVTVGSTTTAYNASQLPVTLNVTNGSSVSYTYSNPVASTTAGKQYRLSSVTGPTSPFTVNGNTTVTGTYVTQYQVTFAQSGIGTDTGTNTVVTVDSAAKNAGNLPFSKFVDAG